MAVINTSTFAKALWPGVNAWYGKAYAEKPTEYTQIFKTHSMGKRAFVQDVGLSGFGLAVVKPEGQGYTYDTEAQGFTTTYRPVTYGLGFVVTREAFEDDQYDVVAPRRARELAFSMRQTKETIAANILNRAFNSSYVGGDSKELCATDHPNRAGGTWRNELSTAADLSEAALEQAYLDIAAFTNDRGLKIAVRPQKLVIPPALEFEAMRVLKTVGRVGTDLNDINAVKEMGMFPGGMVVNHYLTDSDAWFILTDVPEGLKHYERRADEFNMDNDFDTENAKFKASGRYAFGWTDPRCIFGSPGA